MLRPYKAKLVILLMIKKDVLDKDGVLKLIKNL